MSSAEFVLRTLPRRVVIEIAGIVGVEESRLERLEAGLNFAISGAHHVHTHHKSSRSRPSAIADLLADVIKKLEDAERALAMLQGEGVEPSARTPAELAGIFLDQEIDRMVLDEDISNILPWKTEYEQTGALRNVAELCAFLNIVIKAASLQIARLTNAFPKGPGAGSRHPAFDLFVKDLNSAVQSAGGRLTMGRDAYADKPVFIGSLMPVLELLRPYLPADDFFPAGKLGYVLERLVKRA